MVQLSDERRRFIERVATAWKRLGQQAMSGRVLGLLLTADEEYLSSSEIAEQLGVSQPSISNSTRSLLESGMVHRHYVPGDRSHYFAADEDPWANAALRVQPESQLSMRAAVQPTSDLAATLGDRALKRLRNAADYQEWIWERRAELLAEWEEHKRERDGLQDHEQTDPE